MDVMSGLFLFPLFLSLQRVEADERQPRISTERVLLYYKSQPLLCEEPWDDWSLYVGILFYSFLRVMSEFV